MRSVIFRSPFAATGNAADQNNKIVCCDGLDNDELCTVRSMTYDQLVAFTTVAAEGTFTGASQALHKSQPAVSKLIRNLEDELGVVLFDRTRYRATLTDAGRVFHERAAAVVESTHALRGFGLTLGGKVEPIVRLAVDAVTPLDPIAKVLREVETRFPSVRFELRTERLAGVAEALRERRADVVVATMLGIDANEVEAVPFRRVFIVTVARADHAVAKSRPPIPAALLRAHPQIVLRDSAQGAAASLNVLEGGLRWTVTDVSAKKDMILAGMGWGGLPEHVVADELADGTLRALVVPEFAEAMDLFAMRRRDGAHGVVATALWEALGRAGQMPAPMRARRRRRERARR
jgi:DNA-binding transcriptional LysR family regulator